MLKKILILQRAPRFWIFGTGVVLGEFLALDTGIFFFLPAALVAAALIVFWSEGMIDHD